MPTHADAHADPRRDSAVAWLMGRINYERVAHAPYNERQLKLDRMRQLLTRLGSPDAGLRIVHVAGSKGKGSTAAMTAAILTAAGLRTGVYSSPHLERIEERLAIDGRPCEAAALVGLVDRFRPVVAAMDEEFDRDPQSVGPPTFFDITTAMALVHFADQRCDAVVLEVGLGGRLDSTNVCLPAVSVITSISLDHTKQLGDTLGAIAREKAGIIKPGVPVVSGVVDDEPRDAIAEIARARGCRLMERERAFGVEREGGALAFWRRLPRAEGDAVERVAGLDLRMLGEHQQQNAAVAMAAVCELRDQGWPVSIDACRAGLATARLPARVEWFDATADRCAVVLDTAHNGASAHALVESLAAAPAHSSRTAVLAISRDKQIDDILSALGPAFGRVVATRFLENPRALDPQEVLDLARPHCQPNADLRAMADPVAAFEAAIARTPRDGLVVVTGSFFIAAELRRVLVAERGAKRPAVRSR